MSAIIIELVGIILEENNHALSHKTLTALNEDAKKGSKVQTIGDLLRELSDAADADGVAWNSFPTNSDEATDAPESGLTSGGTNHAAAPNVTLEQVAEAVAAPVQVELPVESAKGSKKRIADHLKKFEAVTTATVATPVSADDYIMLGKDDVIQKGDEWRLRSGLKHFDGSKRRWRKASYVGVKVGTFSESEFRRKA